MTKKRFAVLNTLLTQIEENIPFYEKTNPSVSKSSVGWQLDHSLKVIHGVCTITIKTNPDKYKKNVNLWRSVLFTLCYIPRGKAKAPRVVLPPENITEEDLRKQLQTSKTLIEQLKPLPKKSHFTHHVFGTLSKQQVLRFLEMHTKHHLKIVNDILNKS
jgi:hypothetical protein